MACGRQILSSILNKSKIDRWDQGKEFLESGSMLLEDLIAFSNGRYNIPIRRLSIQELSQATNRISSDRIIVTEVGCYKIFEGFLDGRPIFIKRYKDKDSFSYCKTLKSYAIRDLVIMSLMSSHKNFLKPLGCCLELNIPSLAFEHAGRIELLSTYLHDRTGSIMDNERLVWKSRLEIASDIAYSVVYMHSAFPTPIVHRNLTPNVIFIDQSGSAKLFDISFSVSMPPGETQMEDIVVGTCGYADPEYVRTGLLNEKSDVYGFGMILLELLTGKRVWDAGRGNNHELLNNFVEDFVDKDQFYEIVDYRILVGGRRFELEMQLQAVVRLALRCVPQRRQDRPEMIDVAKELKQIQRSAFS
ncbi:Non-specific serine/threonine protein kinase [Bertholletia excelsa]